MRKKGSYACVGISGCLNNIKLKGVNDGSQFLIRIMLVLVACLHEIIIIIIG